MADGLYCAGVCRLPMELLPMRRLYGGSASPTASAAAGHHGDRQNAETQNCCNVQCTLQSFSILVASVLLQGGIATKEGRPASAVRPWPIASRDGPIRAEKHGPFGPKPGLFAGRYDRHRVWTDSMGNGLGNRLYVCGIRFSSQGCRPTRNLHPIWNQRRSESMRTRWAGQHLSDTDSTATGYFSPQLPQVVRRACRASALADETWQPQTLAEAANALVALDHVSACSYWHGAWHARGSGVPSDVPA